ncbi:DUF2530 domain-containing protein [Bifidobacterium sp.]|jgi:hypothetical protein|uniref:DUF2530 domain-containing protein n=1 Tax=Bifidobacterium sp. TaxID=41200 RepID=UPI0025BB2D8D|nr:DUF2530 domain-containing protein [Bifidobacterium sp.]MCH4209590.1 DUF2530 domain-containing protein [Bifidobacterium sp.]MCI1225011.1 DUF2530 domain-containing protein [Bifidobacterium sp.]
MKIAPIINPDVRKSSPQPAQVDLRKVFLIGTGLWVLATAICAILMLVFDFAILKLLIICAAGIATGIVLLLWERFDRRNYRRLAD